MTDKVALVRLRAKNDQYDAAMAKSKKATEDLAGSSTRFAGMSDKLGKVGSDLTRGVTLPLAVAGAASFKLAKDFGTTFTQMATLAGVPVSELEGLKQSVLDLAGETGQAPAELADALYQIYSSGVPASEAMNVLKASASGASLGLGTTAGVADAVTAALNTYGAANLSATQATDQLTAAVKAGKGEASEFAPQLGNLLPLASQLGISFADTAGSLAFLTRGGNNAATASTKLEGVMRALVKPTQQGRDVLEQVGLSADKLRQVVAEKGLPAALQLLQDKFAGNNELMGKFFEDSEGYIGNLALMKGGGEEWSKVLQEVNDSQGLVAEGMRVLQETDEFKAQQAFADLQATGVEVGTALMPIVSSLAGGLADLAGVFNDLPTPIQRGLIAIGLFAASLGPMVGLAGNGAKAISLFTAAMNAKQLDSFRLGLMGITESGAGATNALGGLLLKASASPVALGAAAIGIAAVAVALIEMADGAKEARNSADDLLTSVQSGMSLEQAYADKVVKTLAGVKGAFDLKGSSNSLKGFTEEFGISAGELTTALLGSEKEYKAFLDTLSTKVESPENFKVLVEILDQMRKSGKITKDQVKDLEAGFGSLGVATDGHGRRVEEDTTKVEGLNDALSKQADEILGVLDAHRAADDASQAYNDSIIAVADAQKAEADAAAAVGDAEDAVTDARENAAQAAAAVVDAEGAVADARKGVAEALRGVESAEKDAADAAEEVTARTEELAVAQREATGDSDAMRDALQKVSDAEADLEAAQQDSLTAQQNLDTARANYGQTLAGLARDAGGAADDVLTAEIRLREAQQRLAELGKDGKPVTADDRLAAQIAIRDAERAVEEAKIRAAEAQAEYDRNQKAGVEGSDAVVEAAGRVEEAADNQAAAQGRLEDAQANVVAVQEAAAQRVIDAQDNLTTAIDNRAAADQRVVDAKDGVVEAQDRVRDALVGVETANRNAQKAIEDVNKANDNVQAKKDAVVAAHAEVEKKIDDVRDAALEAALAIYAMDVKSGDAAGAAETLSGKLRDLAAKLSPDDPMRQAILDTAGALDDLADDYVISINLGGNAAQAILDGTLGDLFGALEVATGKNVGDKGPTQNHSNLMDKPRLGGPSGPSDRAPDASGGWVRQPNGRWYHPRKPGEANYGSGYTDYGPGTLVADMGHMAGGAHVSAAKTQEINVYVNGAKWENPYALATVISERVAHKVALEED